MEGSLFKAMFSGRKRDGMSQDETSVADDTRKLEELAAKARRTVLQQKEELLSQQEQGPESVEEATRRVVTAIDRNKPPEEVVEEMRVLVDLNEKGNVEEQAAAVAMLAKLFPLFSLYEKLISRKRPKTDVAVELSLPSLFSEKEVVASWVHDLNIIVRRGCTRVLTFLGAVAVKTREDDIRRMMVWDDDKHKSIDARLEVIPPAETVAQFVHQATERVGPTLVSLFIDTTKRALPALPHKFEFLGAKHNPCFELDELEEAASMSRQLPGEELRDQVLELPRLERELLIRDTQRRDPNLSALERSQRDAEYAAVNARINAIKNNALANDAVKTLLVTDAERQFAPAWAFEVMGSSVFRYFLSTTSIAAFEMALAKVNRIPGCTSFTLKELICSPGVMDQFAFLVASEFLSSGDAIPDRNYRGRGGGKNGHNTYINIMHHRKLLADKVYTCHIWFESVGARGNPLVVEFQKKIDRGPPEWTELGKRVLEDAPFDGVYGPVKPEDYEYDDEDHRAADERRRETAELVKQWRERMLRYKNMLPKRELVYRG